MASVAAESSAGGRLIGAASRHAEISQICRGIPYITNSTKNEYAVVGKWILSTAGLVVGMIHIGGLTRLTSSGLSMTTWHPLGSLPPITTEEWETEFNRYKEFPEWQQRQDMTLSEFKFIFGWEYGHRMLGRLVGVAFAAPWMYLTARSRIPKGYQKKMFGLLAMGGTQGLVGWWMVKSGLGQDRVDEQYQIRVKPVRLATHLCMALATYGALLWTGLDLFSIKSSDALIQKQKEIVKNLSRDALKKLSRLRTGSMLLTGLTALTVASGALVAGNDAGYAYNTYPMMDDEWIPSEMLDTDLPMYRNITENTATVQWNHRLLAHSTALTGCFLVVSGLFPAAMGARGAASLLLTPQARNGLIAVGATVAGQVTLGITTLLWYVPIELAAAHQLGSVAVFTSGVYLSHALRYAGRSNIIIKEASKKIANKNLISHKKSIVGVGKTSLL